MAQPPHRIAQWLSQRYPRPRVDPEWLQGCYQWLIDQPGADDSSQKFLDNVEAQLLQSDLTDSMLEGTGLPIHVTQVDHPEANARLAGSPVLVEVVAITEIASSAFQLDQIRVVREERTRLGQTDDDEGGEGDLEVEGEGPMPKYPRGMLRFQLSDGSTNLSAVEYRPLPELTLGKTPLGYKMLLRSPVMRRGIAFLEPTTVTLVGYQTEDREVSQSFDFARGLRVRMGLPIEPIGPENDENVQPRPVAAPQSKVRSPLREISPPPQPLYPTYNDDENIEPRRRKVPPSTNSTIAPTQASSASSATLVPSSNGTTVSQYFSSSGASTSAKGLTGFDLGLTTAQASHAPRRNANDDDGEDLFNHFDNIDFFEGDDVENNENAPPPPKPPIVTAPPTSLPKPTKAPRPLVPEESIEIVAFTSSQSQKKKAGSLSTSQPQVKKIEKGKGKEKEPQRPAPPVTTVIDSSVDLGLDPDLFENLDEIDAERFSDPDFVRQQEKEMARIAQTQAQRRSDIPPGSSSISRVTSLDKGKEKGERVVKPLPKSRGTHSSGTQSRSPQPRTTGSPPPWQPRGTAVPKKQVIDLDSSSSSSSPRITQIGMFEEEGLELLENDDDIYEDKENVPVMTRHVRRKITGGGGGGLAGGLFGRSQRSTSEETGRGDVIELSDEEP